jgi:hypothetical protein
MSISTNSFNSELGKNNFIAMHNTTNAICPAISDALMYEQLVKDATKGSAIAMQKLEEIWKLARLMLSDDDLHHLKRLASFTALRLPRTSQMSPSLISSLSEYPANNGAQDAIISSQKFWDLALRVFQIGLVVGGLSGLILAGAGGIARVRGVAVAPVLPVPALPVMAPIPLIPQQTAPAA